MSMNLPPPDPILAALITKNGNYAFVATVVFFLWDWALSLEQEARHFYGGARRARISAFLYFANRALVLIEIIIHGITVFYPINAGDFHSFCRVNSNIRLVITAMNATIVEVLLTLRTYALFDCDRRVLWSLIVLIVGADIMQLGLLGAHQHSEIFLNTLPSPYSGCIYGHNSWSWQRNVPTIIFETTVMILMVIKFIEFGRSGRSTRLSNVLFRDGFIEFTAVSLSTALSMIIELPFISDRRNVLYQLSLQIAPMIAQVCAAHILLNIQDVMQMSDPNHPTIDEMDEANDQHTVSFQMASLLSTQAQSAQDVLNFDMETADSQPIDKTVSNLDAVPPLSEDRASEAFPADCVLSREVFFP